MSKYKNGFTLIEAIVAMGIMAVVLAFGTTGVIRFRNSIELENGYSDMQSIIRTLQNRAKNSSATSIDSLQNGVPEIPDYYGIKIEESNYSLYKCFENNSTNGVNCSQSERDLKSTKFNNISYINTCFIVGFKRATQDIVSINDTGIINDIDKCEIEILHKNLGINRKIIFSLEDNKIELDD